MATPSAVGVRNRPGSKAHAKMVRMSASKVRVVLNLVRGKQVNEALEILAFSERLASEVISKCLVSAVSNAEHNDDLDADELFISACYADEGPTLKRFRPRARGRAGRIHKQTCHITIEVSRYSEDELDQLRVRDELKSEGRQTRSQAKGDGGGADRARRVAKSRAAAEADEASESEDPTDEVEETTEVIEEAATESTESTPTDEVVTEDATSDDAGEEDPTDEVVTEDATSDDAGEEPADAGEDTTDAPEGPTDEVVTDETDADDAGEKN